MRKKVREGDRKRKVKHEKENIGQARLHLPADPHRRPQKREEGGNTRKRRRRKRENHPRGESTMSRAVTMMTHPYLGWIYKTTRLRKSSKIRQGIHPQVRFRQRSGKGYPGKDSSSH